MIRKLRNCFLLLAVLLGLQQGLKQFECKSKSYRAQKKMIEVERMEPALLFYTESEHVLKAEKAVRKLVFEPSKNH